MSLLSIFKKPFVKDKFFWIQHVHSDIIWKSIPCRTLTMLLMVFCVRLHSRNSSPESFFRSFCRKPCCIYGEFKTYKEKIVWEWFVGNNYENILRVCRMIQSSQVSKIAKGLFYSSFDVSRHETVING